MVSCGKDGINLTGEPTIVYTSVPAETEDYSYEFSKRDCSTGVQSFKSLVDVCEGLKDDELNNQCAGEDRKHLYEISECPGNFS